MPKSFTRPLLLALLTGIPQMAAAQSSETLAAQRAQYDAVQAKTVLELQPWKAVDNNILGTKNLITVTNRFAVERFVFVSTDKAAGEEMRQQLGI